jgi:hypothetical protein
MADFNVRSDSVNVEQVMEEIRARIREKRGLDYTEEQIRELAEVKLEKFLDPRGVRSDLLEQFRKLPASQPYAVPLYPFETSTLFDSHRPVVRFLRRLFKPILKLVFNVNALSQSLHQQAEINRQTAERLERLDTPLYFELMHNLVVEFTRVTIEVKNTKMRVESIASRLEFNERRARALESVVMYKPEESSRTERMDTSERSGPPERSNRPQSDGRFDRRPDSRPEVRPDMRAGSEAPPFRGGAGETAPQPATPGTTPAFQGEGPGQRSRRRRRRRGRRGGASAVATMTGGENATAQAPTEAGGVDANDISSQETTATESASPSGDARDTRPEPLENTFGAASHPAEPQAASNDSTAQPSESRVATDTPDADGQ